MLYPVTVFVRTAFFLVCCLWFAAVPAWAGGGGFNVIVVVNQNSTNSVQLGNDYCEQRGVPPQNVLRLTNWTGGSINWTPGNFQTNLLNPLLALMASRGLAHQAQFVLLSMDIPYRVTDGSSDNSTTSALFYGFKTNTAFAGGPASCSLPDNTSNSYAYSELPFTEAPPDTAVTNSFLAMMLTDTNLAAAENILSRGVAADGTFPTQTVYLAKTSDWARNVRFTEFDNAVFENQVAGNGAVVRLDTDSTAFTNLFGLLTGLADLSLPANAFVPGALGDSLTSFAGDIFENVGQTPLLAFLEAGAAGSYGTVVEPCNYTQKFPDPVDYFYQARGFSVAEAYYQSVLNPFEGLLVGDPLAAPFAHTASANWDALTNGTRLSGPVVLSPVFTAAAANLPLAQADLFVDGTYFQTLTNLPPEAGNVVSVTLNGDAINYTVPANANLATVATGLAAALNLQSGATQVKALPFGDRIELQSLAASVPGSNVAVSASTAAGSAAMLNTWLAPARPAFLDSTATGYQVVTISNSPGVGGWVQVTFIKTNGTMVTLGVTNTVSGATVGTLARKLVNLINTNAALQTADGVVASDFGDYDPYGEAEVQFFLYPRTAGWAASEILATWTTSSSLVLTPSGTNPLADNVSDLRPRNHLYVSSGANSLAVNAVFDTTQIADGDHELTAVAYEGTSVATQTRVTRRVRVQNTSLSATLSTTPGGTNVLLGQTLQFTVSATPAAIASLELFSTGGSWSVVSNQAAATFAVSASDLGQGLHPFYALVTGQSGNRFQTATVWYRVVANFSLVLANAPPTLCWPATAGRQYEVQMATNLLGVFQTLAIVTASNSVGQWPVSATNRAAFYRVKLDP